MFNFLKLNLVPPLIRITSLLVLKRVLFTFSNVINSLFTSFESGGGHLDNISAILLLHVSKVFEDFSHKKYRNTICTWKNDLQITSRILENYIGHKTLYQSWLKSSKKHYKAAKWGRTSFHISDTINHNLRNFSHKNSQIFST